MNDDIKKLLLETAPPLNETKTEITRPAYIPKEHFEHWKKVVRAAPLIQAEMKDCHPLYVKHKLDEQCHKHGITVEEYFGEQARRGLEVRRQLLDSGEFYAKSRAAFQKNLEDLMATSKLTADEVLAQLAKGSNPLNFGVQMYAPVKENGEPFTIEELQEAFDKGIRPVIDYAATTVDMVNGEILGEPVHVDFKNRTLH